MKKILFVFLFMKFYLVFSQKTSLNELLFLREEGDEKEVMQTFEKNGWKLETYDKASENKTGLLIFEYEESELTNDEWSVLKFYFINSPKNENQIEHIFKKKEIYDSYLKQIRLSDFKLIDSFNSTKWTKLFYQKKSTIIIATILKRKDENGIELEFYEISLTGLKFYLKKKNSTRNNNR